MTIPRIGKKMPLNHHIIKWKSNTVMCSLAHRIQQNSLQTQSKSQEFPSSLCVAKWSQTPGVLRIARKARDMKRDAM